MRSCLGLEPKWLRIVLKMFYDIDHTIKFMTSTQIMIPLFNPGIRGIIILEYVSTKKRGQADFMEFRKTHKMLEKLQSHSLQKHDGSRDSSSHTAVMIGKRLHMLQRVTLFVSFLASITAQELSNHAPTRSQLGPNLGGPQIDPKLFPRAIQNRILFSIVFCFVF